MRVLSHPFRLSPTGEVATVLDGSSEAHAEAIAVLATTKKGERVLVPDFGITDPVFAGVDAAELVDGLATFGPDGVTITDLTTTYSNDHTAQVRIEFED